jgi:hypothetical protein
VAQVLNVHGAQLYSAVYNQHWVFPRGLNLTIAMAAHRAASIHIYLLRQRCWWRWGHQQFKQQYYKLTKPSPKHWFPFDSVEPTSLGLRATLRSSSPSARASTYCLYFPETELVCASRAF